MDDDKKGSPGVQEDSLGGIGTQVDRMGQAVSAGTRDTSVRELGPENLIAVPVDSIPMGIALPCAIYIRVAGRLVTFRSQGERLSPKRALGLQEKGAQVLYIHRAAWEIFLDGLEKLKLPEPITPESASQHLRDLIVAYGLELERVIREPKRPLFEKLEKLCDSLATLIRSNPGLGTRLLRKNDDPAVRHVTHSVNSAIYAAVMAFKLNRTMEEMKLVTFAALVHDIGKLLIPKKLLSKSKMTQEEREFVNSHTRRGAEVLQEMGCPPPVVLAALQHHERMDGRGYPSKLSGSQIHPLARICTIVDAYDTLTSARPDRPAISPDEALLKMRSLEGKFDVNFLGKAISR